MSNWRPDAPFRNVDAALQVARFRDGFMASLQVRPTDSAGRSGAEPAAWA